MTHPVPDKHSHQSTHARVDAGTVRQRMAETAAPPDVLGERQSITPTPRTEQHPFDDQTDALDLIGLITSGQLRSVFQPIVRLDRLTPIGVEALVRGPAGSRWESPAALFDIARRTGRTRELDWASRRTALEGALNSGLTGPATLFVNAEPEGLDSRAFPGIDAIADAVAQAGVQVVLEITERALTTHPAELLRTVERVRELGWRLAVDDVGAERASLALLPIIDPDVIKLDLRLIQARTTVDVAEIINAVLAQSERTGAVVLAEGIETEAHLDLARSMDATLGQGWFFGRPGPLAPDVEFGRLSLPARRPEPAPLTPWQLAQAPAKVATAGKPLLVAMSKTLERQAQTIGDAAVILGAFQTSEFFTPATARRYADLARAAALVCTFGTGMEDLATPRVRHNALRAGDPLELEWDVVIVGPHFAAALIAVEHSRQPQPERLFDYLLTYDRDRVLAAARSLLDRTLPARE